MVGVRRVVCALLATAVCALCCGATPMKISFQGKLLDDQNVPRNGPFDMVFKVYAEPSGGTALYSESQSVPVSNGVFSVQIGSVSALAPELFSGTSAYLGVTVAGDSEMTPRVQLLAAPYSFTAAQLAHGGAVLIHAGLAYSTFTAGGNLKVPAGIVAATASLSGSLTASSATFSSTGSDQYSLQTASSIWIQAGKLRMGTSGRSLYEDGAAPGLKVSTNLAVLGNLAASSATFSASGPGQYSVKTSSGIWIESGVLQIGGSPARVVYVNVGEGAVAVSTHLSVSGNIDAANFGIEKLLVAELGSAAATLDTGAFPVRRRLLVTIGIPGTASAAQAQLRFNGDTGSNYQYRISDDNTAATTSAGAAQMILQEGTGSANERQFRLDILNISSENKSVIVSGSQFVGAASAPTMVRGAAFWENTSAQITSIELRNSAGANFNVGTRISVFGVSD